MFIFFLPSGRVDLFGRATRYKVFFFAYKVEVDPTVPPDEGGPGHVGQHAGLRVVGRWQAPGWRVFTACHTEKTTVLPTT